MVKQVTATEAKVRILSLLDEVEAGEVIEITRRGKVVARLASARGAHALRGRFASVAMTSDEEANLFSIGETWDAS